MKKDLLKQISPPVSLPNTPMYQSSKTSKSIQDDNLQEFSKKYIRGSGGAEFEDKHQLSPELGKFSKEQLFRIEPGQDIKTLMVNGKFMILPVKEYEYKLDELSLRKRLQGLMINTGVGGLNLSGFKEKKMSKKSKDILENVFNIKVEE